MGEFFKGWRRKAGLVTLAMASLLTCGWFRTYAATDWLNVHTSEFTIHSLGSLGGSLIWSDVDGREPKFIPKVPTWHTGKAVDINDKSLRENGRQRIHWLGFEVVNFDVNFFVGETQPLVTFRRTIWIVPYWMLVLPLALLSAWLILGKARKTKPAASVSLAGRDESSK